MKKRTGIIGVLIAILVLGIGYAAITGVDLLVDGTGKVVPDSENFAVHYDTANAPTVTIGTGVKDTATVTATYTDGLHATINVNGFTKKGDSATVVYTIVNDSEDIAATLGDPEIDTTDLNSEYFTVTASLGTTELAADGGTTTLTVVVSAIKTPIDTEQETEIHIDVPADPVS